MPVTSGDLRQAQRWRAVRSEYAELLLEQRDRICKEIVRQYRDKKSDPRIFVGLAGELAQVDLLLGKIERNIIDAEREVEHGL